MFFVLLASFANKVGCGSGHYRELLPNFVPKTYHVNKGTCLCLTKSTVTCARTAFCHALLIVTGCPRFPLRDCMYPLQVTLRPTSLRIAFCVAAGVFLWRACAELVVCVCVFVSVSVCMCLWLCVCAHASHKNLRGTTGTRYRDAVLGRAAATPGRDAGTPHRDTGTQRRWMLSTFMVQPSRQSWKYGPRHVSREPRSLRRWAKNACLGRLRGTLSTNLFAGGAYLNVQGSGGGVPAASCKNCPGVVHGSRMQSWDATPRRDTRTFSGTRMGRDSGTQQRVSRLCLCVCVCARACVCAL